MFYGVTLVASVAAQEIAEQSTKFTNIGDITGIGGIIATLFAMVVTSFVTWKATKRSISEKKISYSRQISPLFANSVIQNNSTALNKLEISYGNNQLRNPHLLSIDIENTGNVVVENPRAKIRCQESIHIVPGYFEDVPGGYEDKWKFEEIPDSPNICVLSLEYINPGQVVHARFFLDDKPEQEIDFECPMAGLQTQRWEMKNHGMDSNKNEKKYLKCNIALGIAILILLISGPNLYDLLDFFLWKSYYFDTHELILFVIGTLTLTLLVNIVGLDRFDKYVKEHPKEANRICTVLFVLCVVLLALIIPNIIAGFVPQAIIAVFVSACFAFIFHRLFLSI